MIKNIEEEWGIKNIDEEWRIKNIEEEWRINILRKNDCLEFVNSTESICLRSSAGLGPPSLLISINQLTNRSNSNSIDQ